MAKHRTEEPSDGPMLEVTDMVVNYGRIQALHGISLRVGAGRVVTLLGANGAGKSTTMRAMSGLIPLRGGKIVVRRSRHHAREGARTGHRGHGAGSGGARRVPGHDRPGEPRHGALCAQVRVQGRLHRAAGLGLRTLPAALGAAHPGGRHAVRRRAADGRDRALADGAAASCCCSTSRRWAWRPW